MQVIRHTVERAFLALFVLGLPSSLLAQNVIGSSGPSGGFAINPGPPPVTIIDNFFVARTSFTAKRARFNWSNAPCIGAVKIKFFRASGPAANPTYHFLEERGPFDVIRASNQLVSLYPPVSITPGEQIGITTLTACGGPVAFTPGGIASGLSETILSGDVVGDVVASAGRSLLNTVSIEAEEPPVPVSLLGRFDVFLVARNPRTGALADGYGAPIAVNAGYFSLPDFTGDPTFPEVTVKMIDATAAPPPFGGSFWFFFSPITDVEFALTVRDSRTLATRTYTNLPSAAGQFCGGADTDAFRP